MKITDQLGRTLELNTVPKRMVSLVPSLTELIVDLGLESQLVGLTKFCVHPEYLRREKTRIGGTKQLKVDKIHELAPDFILANKEENTPDSIKQLSENIPIYVSDINTISDLYELIVDLGTIFNCSDQATALNDQLQSKITNFNYLIKNKPKPRIAYFIWREPWMVAANATFIDYLLQLSGFVNVYAHTSRYPEVTLDELNALKLDYIFLSSEPFPFSEKHFSEFPLKPDKICLVNGEYFSWYGSRLLHSFDYFLELRQQLNI